MAPVRKLLRAITGNVRRGRELSQRVRGVIESAHALGKSGVKISKDTEIPTSTISDTLQLAPLRDEQRSRPRRG